MGVSQACPTKTFAGASFFLRAPVASRRSSWVGTHHVTTRNGRGWPSYFVFKSYSEASCINIPHAAVGPLGGRRVSYQDALYRSGRPEANRFGPGVEESRHLSRQRLWMYSGHGFSPTSTVPRRGLR